MLRRLPSSRRTLLLAALTLACSSGPSRCASSLPGRSLPKADASGGAVYPATPHAPPPVPPPSGQGTSVRHERYLVVDQFGYRTKMTKIAILVDPVRGWNAADHYEPGPSFEVRRWADGTVAWTGAPRAWKGGALDEASGDRGAWLDFSELERAGLYYVYDVKNAGRSYPFAIDDDVYRPVLKSAVRMFYFNRANLAKQPPYACVGKRCWSIGVDYLGPGQDGEARSVTDRDNPKTARDLRGGWWDAGDTNKYVTFSSGPVHELFTAYQEHPQAFTDDYGIPESGNGLPDLLDELLVEIGWLERMQPPDLHGGALVKVGTVEQGEPVPDRSKLRRFYYPEPCSAATIAIAGEFAHAALVLRAFPSLGGRAQALGERARNAWRFFHQNPKSDACDDLTIQAGDADRTLTQQTQDAVVAAVYLFALTGEPEYRDFVSKNYAQARPFVDDRWSVYEAQQGDALLVFSELPGADDASKQAILTRKRAGMATVDYYGMKPELDLYRAYMRKDSYHWGSNLTRAGFGNTNYDVLVHALAPDSERTSFEERAAGMLHSFHGVNPLGLVYVTNLYADGGDACADEMFHNWFRDKDPRWDNARTSELGPAPGYVTGGPNAGYCAGQNPAEHACAASPVRAQPPGKAYVDTNTGWDPSDPYDRSWELTEPSTSYQAGYVRLVSKFVK